MNIIIVELLLDVAGDNPVLSFAREASVVRVYTSNVTLLSDSAETGGTIDLTE